MSGPRVPVPDHFQHGITVDHVTFRYPGDQRPVLADVTIEIPAGSTLALVGENGAGKSTLVKLLCGLYQPTSVLMADTIAVLAGGQVVE